MPCLRRETKKQEVRQALIESSPDGSTQFGGLALERKKKGVEKD